MCSTNVKKVGANRCKKLLDQRTYARRDKEGNERKHRFTELLSNLLELLLKPLSD